MSKSRFFQEEKASFDNKTNEIIAAMKDKGWTYRKEKIFGLNLEQDPRKDKFRIIFACCYSLKDDDYKKECEHWESQYKVLDKTRDHLTNKLKDFVKEKALPINSYPVVGEIAKFFGYKSPSFSDLQFLDLSFDLEKEILAFTKRYHGDAIRIDYNESLKSILSLLQTTSLPPPKQEKNFYCVYDPRTQKLSPVESLSIHKVTIPEDILPESLRDQMRPPIKP